MSSKKAKWFSYTRGTVCFYRISPYFLSVHHFATKLTGLPIEDIIYINIGPKTWWAWDDQQINNLGKHILRECKTASGTKRHLQKLYAYIREGFRTVNVVLGKDLKKLSDKKLAELYDYLYLGTAKAHGTINADIDAVDIVLEEHFRGLLWKELKGKVSPIEFSDLYRKISAPLYESYVASGEREIRKLALKKNTKDQEIAKLYEKYWWTNLGWENIKPYSRNYFSAMVKKYAKDKNNKKRLADLSGSLKNTKKLRKIYFQKYKFSKRINYWLDVLDEYAIMHDLRKELQMKTLIAFNLLAKEVARRRDVSMANLEWLAYNEVRDFLLGKKIDRREIKKRRKAISVRVSRGGLRVKSGSAALDECKKEFEVKAARVRSLKGLAVTHGKVRGRVKICNDAKQALGKIRKGDILVAGMTTPDFVSTMRKAVAIVTNEGGITCHAAIISRELGIPCIVGTKVATQVFKDGEMVEVNANHGVIKKLRHF